MHGVTSQDIPECIQGYERSRAHACSWQWSDHGWPAIMTDFILVKDLMLDMMNTAVMLLPEGRAGGAESSKGTAAGVSVR